MVICLLCLQKNKNQIKLCSKKSREQNISKIISKHFWLQPNAEKDSKESVCLPCWKAVKDFHDFFQTVVEAHNYLETENEHQWTPFPQSKNEPVCLLTDLGETDEIKLELDALDSLPGTEVIEIVHTKFSEQKTEKQYDDKTESPIKLIKKENEAPPYLTDNDSDSEIPLSKFVQSNLKVDDDKPLSDDKLLSEPEEFDNNDFMPANESSDAESDDEPLKIKEKESSTPIVFAELPTKKKDSEQSKKKYKKKKSTTEPPKKRGFFQKIETIEKYDETIAKMFDNFQCSECQLYVKNFSDLLTHFKDKHTPNRPSVTCCERRFFTRPTLAEHVMVHLNPEHFKCEECGHLSRDRLQFADHKKKHVVGFQREKKYECPICEQKLSAKPMLEKHILVKHTAKSEFKFDCPECPKKFPTKTCVRKHLKDTHHGGRSAMCDHCGKVCQTKYILRKHIAHEHMNIPKPDPIKAQCEVCLNWFRDIYSVRIHMKTAHDSSDQQHKCQICGYISVNARSLQRHIDYIHNLERTHQCSLCDKSFRRPHELKEHTATHTGKELFNCTICSLPFYSKANYYKHKCKEHGHVPQPIRRIFDLNKKPKKEKEKKVEEEEVDGADPTKKKRRRRKKKNAPEETEVQNPTATAVEKSPTVIEISEDVSSLHNFSVKEEPFIPQNFSTFEGANLQQFSESTAVSDIPGHFLTM